MITSKIINKRTNNENFSVHSYVYYGDNISHKWFAGIIFYCYHCERHPPLSRYNYNLDRKPNPICKLARKNRIVSIVKKKKNIFAYESIFMNEWMTSKALNVTSASWKMTRFPSRTYAYNTYVCLYFYVIFCQCVRMYVSFLQSLNWKLYRISLKQHIHSS